MPKEKKRNISMLCEVSLERRIRIEAAKRDMNKTQFILAAVREKLERIDREGEVITRKEVQDER